jgi:flagellin-like hook-associated protein FlgL
MARGLLYSGAEIPFSGAIAMRVTQEIYYRNSMRDIFNLQYQQVFLDKQITTGQKVNLPSDSPSNAVTILDSRHLMFQVTQYRANLEAADNWMTASESSMTSIKDLFTQAKTLAEQMATGTIQPNQHASTATEVQNILNEIIKLANTQVEGDYIFSGSRTDIEAISSWPMADNPAVRLTDSSRGTGAIAQIYQDPGTGLFHMEMTRDTPGATSTVTFPVPNTLGNSAIPPFNFSSAGWAQVQLPGPTQAGIWRTNQNVATTGTAISNQVGEELTYLADPTAGNQTYRTDGLITVTGAGNVTINGVGYAVASAADLANQVNAAASPDYFAHLDAATNTVRIISKGTGAFDITLPVGAVAINDSTTLQQLETDLNAGQRATAMFQVTGAGLPPLATDTVTIGDNTWTWDEIAGGAVLVTAADHANALAAHVNSQTNEYEAVVATSGADATVMLTARAKCDAANSITLGSSHASVTHTGTFFGGCEGGDTRSEGSIYATGTSTLRLGTNIRGTVLDVASSGTVTARLEWYDDDGILQVQDVAMPATGETNAVAITGTGGLSLYRDDLPLHEGAIFNLEVGRYRGNNEDLAVNFAEGGKLVYNWTAEQLLGGVQTINLLGAEAAPNAPTVAGSLSLAGAYRGLRDREITFDVVSGGTVPGGQVQFKVSFIDDNGTQHVETIALDGAGRNNAVVLPINGVRPKVDLTGQTATPDPANVGADVLNMAGYHRGLTDRDFTFTVTAVNGPQITMDVTWVNDQGNTITESVTTTNYGVDHEIEIPGADGVKFYMTQGAPSAQVGDVYTYDIEMHPDNAGDGVFFYVDNQTFNTGESFYYKIDQQPVHILDVLSQWQYQLNSGDAEAAQSQSQKALDALDLAIKNITEYMSEAGTRKNRVTTRRTVLTENELYAATNLEELQNVDIEQAFLELRANMTVYNASLTTISKISNLFLANLI